MWPQNLEHTYMPYLFNGNFVFHLEGKAMYPILSYVNYDLDPHRYLEEKICSLVAKLHEYHCDLQKKTEEIVKTRQHAVGELEWVKQSMMKFEQNLLEFNGINQPQIDSTNTQVGSCLPVSCLKLC